MTGRAGAAVVLASCLLAHTARGAGWEVERGQATDPSLPRVLMIGDSILNGYKATVKKHLGGKAIVDTWTTPLWISHAGLIPGLTKAVEGHRYGVVHFNHGLHGFANRIPEGQYLPLMRKYIAAMRRLTRGAALIWASTTPVTVKDKPDLLDPDKNALVAARNTIAAKVMWENGVEVNDLYGLVVGKPDLRSNDGFHYSAKGQTVQADAVARCILAALERRAAMSPDERVWDQTLRENLGSFYLPRYLEAKAKGRVTAWDFVKDDPKLPRVLLIGDSISRGYTVPVRKRLAAKANVHRAPANCGPTTLGLRSLDVWLGGGKWDVIHFNFGIHDRRAKPEDYAKRLEQIAQRLEATGAKLIWATTTPVPEGAAEHVANASERLNAVAAAVMEHHKIPTNDLCAHIKPHLATCQLPRNCHFKGEGYDFLGQKVADAILAALQ